MAQNDKGKGKEEDFWKPGWWQFSSLGEMQTPIVWTRNSTIIMGHPSQPAVYGRVFPSSRPFIIPSPRPVLGGAYGPPTNLSIAPDDKHLFAFFPSTQGLLGVGCLWTCEQTDVWNVKEFWLIVGCVAVTWLGAPREWVTNGIGPSRLPPRGPRTPHSSVTLAMVSQDMQLHVCFIRRDSGALKMLSCSLCYPNESTEDSTSASVRSGQGPEGVRVCSVATIGLSYNEDSILVATVSKRLPGPAVGETGLSLEMSMSINMSGTFAKAEPTVFDDWDCLGSETVLELMEARLGSLDGSSQLNLSVTPLPTVVEFPGNLSKLLFVPANEKDTQHKLYLVALSMEDGDYSTSPATKLTSWAIARLSRPPHNWGVGPEMTRSFNDEVIIFVQSHHSVSASSTLLVGTVHAEMQLPRHRGKSKELAIGHISALNASNLTDLEAWPKVPLLVPADGIHSELPFDIALSPSGSLACSTSAASSLRLRVLIHLLPRPNLPTDVEPLPAGGIGYTTSLLQSRKPWDELAHTLGNPVIPLEQAERLLFATATSVDGCTKGAHGVHEHDLLGLLVATYRARWRNTSAGEAKDDLLHRWSTALDMCSIVTTHKAFVFCKERGNDDYEAVWQLIQVSTWFVGFMQELLRQCVLLSDARDGESEADSSVDKLSPMFLHILHPKSLQMLHALLHVVKGFYEQLTQHKAIGENSQIAKHFLADTVECSGFKFPELDNVLTAVAEDVKGLDDAHLARSLALCYPVPELHASLRSMIIKIVEAGAIDRPQLFLNASDLISGFLRMDISDKRHEEGSGPRDIVSKSLLLPTLPSLECLRCGGRTQIYTHAGSKQASKGWAIWERVWSQRCICGGNWSSGGYTTSLGSQANTI